MSAPLMPKATAIWLIDNTTLTFEQIADFCGLHSLEIQAIADGEAAIGLIGHDPVASGELTLDEIERCQTNPADRLRLSPGPQLAKPKQRSKYTPLFLRQAKPSAIAWLLKELPLIKDAEIMRILGTTRATIQAIREKTHRDMNTLKPQSPSQLGLCRAEDINDLLKKYRDVDAPAS